MCWITVGDLECWSSDTDKQYAVPLVRQADVDNHNVDGGLWAVAGGCVYDVDHLRAQFTPQQVEHCIRKPYPSTVYYT